MIERIRLQRKRPVGVGSASSLLVLRSGERAPVGREGGQLDSDTAENIESRRSGGSALAGDTRHEMESAFGHNFGDVRVHTGPEDDSLARSVGALAFTTRSDIFFRSGSYSTDSSEGKHVLAHELAHVVQQRTMSTSGPPTVGAADDSYEVAAESAAYAVDEGLAPKSPGRASESIGRHLQRCGATPCNCPPDERAMKEAAMSEDAHAHP